MKELDKYEKQRENYNSNTACMIGFFQGALEVYGKELMKENGVWTRQEMGEKILKLVEISDLWYGMKYEGPFRSDDIREMLEKKKNSDIVELEKA
jgi:hypothetical protein